MNPTSQLLPLVFDLYDGPPKAESGDSESEYMGSILFLIDRARMDGILTHDEWQDANDTIIQNPDTWAGVKKLARERGKLIEDWSEPQSES